MALSFASYLSRPQQDVRFKVGGGESGEDVILRGNEDVFSINGQLLGHARFSAEKETHLFTMVWPRLQAKCASTLSCWHLVVTKATDDRIAHFNRDTADKLGMSNWEIVKTVVEECKAKFDARLLSMSSQEIVFIHSDVQMAEQMKNSNEMVDIMNTLLANVENSFSDILVDWSVRITPVTVSLSYIPPFQGQGQGECQNLERLDSVLLTDADTPLLGNSRNVSRTSVDIVLTPQLQRLLDLVVAENRETRVTLKEMAKDNIKRHRILCQKIEEMKNSLRAVHQKLGLEGNDMVLQSEPESDFTDNIQAEDNQFEGEEVEEMIPSAELFESGVHPFFQDQDSSHGHHTIQGNADTDNGQTEGSGNESPGNQNRRPSNNGEREFSPPVFPHQAQDDSFTKCPMPSETFQDTPLSGSELENRNLEEAVTRASMEDEEPQPRAKSYNTMLCLDISDSMKGNGAYEQMMEVVHTFIDGVENVVIDTGVEENIGVVTFGGTSNVVQSLTNDFSRVRQAIDRIELHGKSPFVQALLVAMAAFSGKAGVISLSGVYDVKPRILFISDGHPTENIDDQGVDTAKNRMHVRTALTTLMMNFASKEKYSKVHPVIYIPVGSTADKELMKSMATLSKGIYMEPTEVNQLCGYFMVQETIGKTLGIIKSKKDHSPQQIEALITGLMPCMTKEQKDEVIKVVKQEKESPSKKCSNRLSDLDDMYENTETVNAGEMLPLGTRVIRGPDWKWGDQDQGGPGTVISHSDKKGWSYVAWDFGHYNRYAFGPDHGYDILWTSEHPRLMENDNQLQIGMTVEKGPDWNSNNSSRESRLSNVQTGLIIRKSKRQKKLMVRWNNGEMQVVQDGTSRHEVIYRDPFTIQQEANQENQTAPFHEKEHWTSEEASKHNNSPASAVGKTSPPLEFENGRWQWKREDGKWVDFDGEVSDTIEKQYKRRRDGTCVINRDGKNRRVMFKRMTEKVIDGGIETAVNRVPA